MLMRLAATAGLLTLGTSLALAQTTAPGTTAPAPAPGLPSAAGGATSASTTRTGGDAKEWQAAKIAKISLSQALSTAESKGEEKGGRAIDADFENIEGKDPAHYEIKVVYPSGKLVEHYINADTGELYKTENQPIERYFTRLKAADFQNAKTPLKDALAMAEQKVSGGKAFEAEVSKDGSAVQYEIKVAGADREQTVKVGADGKVVD
ncbi:MAG: PepSY domain-containing protein [Methylobacterium sp.]|uniref:PepSY domain-containing protein n=1 Tax=Methylobacterium sp. TaxID=409 RepID=UPI0025E1F860|nr:PepSY domain-containing protein [Methylobacterium sp.]MBX9933227.1 PepSY domain-containing protein [Methylobacterium sp.]